ncbi:auxin-responsive protein SAUR68-like [Euphorbia lathyris]|uniref:auxin-responsive protein SAUR68-like n=1 Tax=Euphorbia lathyris TaxID=212925 RepID=UPI003313F1DC
MITPKKLLKLARKWQKLAAIRRKRITFPTMTVETTHTSTSVKAEKGCFVVYSADQKRFLLPLEYLNNEIIIHLFNMAEEEFGLPSNAPLTLTCHSELLEYAISLIKQRVTTDIERSLLTCIASCSSSSLSYQVTSHQSLICSF